MPPILKVNNIEVLYNNIILVLKGLSLQVEEGTIVALLGSNGAGKSTTLKAISGPVLGAENEIMRRAEKDLEKLTSEDADYILENMVKNPLLDLDL